MNIQRGMRDKLENHLNPGQPFDVLMEVSGSAEYDYCCFGVDASGKLSDDRYMVFYNQPSSPAHEIEYSAAANRAQFKIRLAQLPQTIQKLVFTVSIDGGGVMGDIHSHKLTIRQGAQPPVELNLLGSDFQKEKAIISIEIYKKDVWRFAAVASGFNGGLGDLLRAYGGEEASAPAPAPVPAPAPAPAQPVQKTEKVSLKKGQKISLTKSATGAVIIENGWTAANKDYDLKALVRYRDGRLIYVGAANSDEVLSTPEGAVRHGGDIKRPGELEHITITWHPSIASVAVSSYSAIENGLGSFNEYGVFVRIKNGNQTIEIPAADTSANRQSYTLCFGEILFGEMPNDFNVSALEMYSKPRSENRIGYRRGKVVMDIGPSGRTKS